MPKNKPKALNTALPYCSGDDRRVFDAEDQVHPALLAHVDPRSAGRADVVQGGVQLINFQSSWYTLRNCLEYFFWFRSRLHLHAERRFIPLGGNTVFVRPAPAAGRRLGPGVPGRGLRPRRPAVERPGRGSLSPTTRTMVTREETPDTSRRLSSSGPAGTRASCRCCARASGAGCRPGGSAGWPATRWPCRSCRLRPGW